MKNWIIISTIMLSLLFGACSEPDDGGFGTLDNQENTVVFKVKTNKKGAILNIEGAPDSSTGYLTVTDSYEAEFVTKSWGVEFISRCDDDQVMMEGEIYINGVLKQELKANKRLKMGLQIKFLTNSIGCLTTLGSLF